MSQSGTIAPCGACTLSLEERSLLAQLLDTPAVATPWAAARLTPTKARVPYRLGPARPVTKRTRWRPVAGAAAVLLAGGIVAASIGATPARSAALPVQSAVAFTARGAAGFSPATASSPVQVGRLAVPARAERALLMALLASPVTPAAALSVGLGRDEGTALGAAAGNAPSVQVAAQAVAGFNLATAAPAVYKAVQASPRAAATSVESELLTSLLAAPLASSFELGRDIGAGSSAAVVAAAEAASAVAATALDEEPPPPPAPPFPVEVVEIYEPPAPVYIEPLAYYTRAPRVRYAPLHANGILRGNSYIVAQGDTLWSIAVRVYGNGQRWHDILRANAHLLRGHENNIRAGHNLALPRVLYVYRYRLHANGVLRGNTYTVAQGDTLWGIAVRVYGNGQRWHDILRANAHLLYGYHGNLRGGQRLHLP